MKRALVSALFVAALSLFGCSGEGAQDPAGEGDPSSASASQRPASVAKLWYFGDGRQSGLLLNIDGSCESSYTGEGKCRAWFVGGDTSHAPTWNEPWILTVEYETGGESSTIVAVTPNSMTERLGADDTLIWEAQEYVKTN